MAIGNIRQRPQSRRNLSLADSGILSFAGVSSLYERHTTGAEKQFRLRSNVRNHNGDSERVGVEERL